jgi:hypothetical protein
LIDGGTEENIDSFLVFLFCLYIMLTVFIVIHVCVTIGNWDAGSLACVIVNYYVCKPLSASGV